MRVALRAVLVLAVFGAVGLLAARAVLGRAAPATPAPEVHLAAAMAGLFAGGAAAALTLIAMLWTGRHR